VTVWSTVDKNNSRYPDSPIWDSILAPIRRSGTTNEGYTNINGHLVKGDQSGGEYVNNGPYSGILIVK
jgi:hypothetical protein